jgi:hypothetical protein
MFFNTTTLDWVDPKFPRLNYYLINTIYTVVIKQIQIYLLYRYDYFYLNSRYKIPLFLNLSPDIQQPPYPDFTNNVLHGLQLGV